MIELWLIHSKISQPVSHHVALCHVALWLEAVRHRQFIYVSVFYIVFDILCCIYWTEINFSWIPELSILSRLNSHLLQTQINNLKRWKLYFNFRHLHMNQTLRNKTHTPTKTYTYFFWKCLLWWGFVVMLQKYPLRPFNTSYCKVLAVHEIEIQKFPCIFCVE